MAENDLTAVRAEIDAIDSKIRELLMKRYDCSQRVAEIKAAAGETTIYRADREAAMLKRLSEGVPADRRVEYLAAVKKIIETSRMYQYGLLYDKLPEVDEKLMAGAEILPEGTVVKIRLTRPNHPGAMAEILSMIGDYGYDMATMELLSLSEDETEASFELGILGSLKDRRMRKLLFQLSEESTSFVLLGMA